MPEIWYFIDKKEENMTIRLNRLLLINAGVPSFFANIIEQCSYCAEASRIQIWVGCVSFSNSACLLPEPSFTSSDRDRRVVGGQQISKITPGWRQTPEWNILNAAAKILKAPTNRPTDLPLAKFESATWRAVGIKDELDLILSWVWDRCYPQVLPNCIHPWKFSWRIRVSDS